ncbi:MAG TPA: DUF4375 domain-containing protein [Verrucomicrobiota bacterium]|nr:DUF4375 domain-containing protein [Verrucomicrobiota bacterium]HNT16205.1 DUF4375 domain-containing protein [Verrucomicrobiota bacterium]
MIAPEEKIAEARATYGRSIGEILAKEPERGIYKVLGAIEVLVGSKIHQKLPTSPSERMIFAFTWLAREVQNGGFHQFFVNSAGDFWKDVSSGLVAVGDENGSALFRQVLSIFPDSSPSEDRDARLNQLDELEEQDEDRVWDHFKSVTDHYFRTPFPNWELVYVYVKTHPDEFDLRNA